VKTIKKKSSLLKRIEMMVCGFLPASHFPLDAVLLCNFFILILIENIFHK
jgi:hypothetical protein